MELGYFVFGFAWGNDFIRITRLRVPLQLEGARAQVGSEHTCLPETGLIRKCTKYKLLYPQWLVAMFVHICSAEVPKMS